MKKICFFLGDVTRGGGCERVALTVANGLRDTGRYDICLLSIVEQKKEPFFAVSDQIRRFVLREDGNWIIPGTGYIPLIPLIRRFLKRQKVDIIIDVDLVLDVLSLPATFGMEVKVISWEHFHYYYEQSILYRKIITWFSALLSDHIVTLTERDRVRYERRLHCRRKITAISNPVDMQDNRSISKEKALITVGRLEYAKGTEMLAQIVPDVLGRYADWKWYFLGEGEDKELMERICREYGLENRLILTGVVRNVNEYLRASSIMVMASRSEGLPMSLLEARAYGLPCIAFDVPLGPSELIEDGMNGFLIAPFQLDEMKDRIGQLVEDDGLRERFSKAARSGLEQYRLDHILEKWVCLLDALSSGRTKYRQA